MLMIPISDVSLKITILRSQSYLPGANELTHGPLGDAAAIFSYQFSHSYQR